MTSGTLSLPQRVKEELLVMTLLSYLASSMVSGKEGKKSVQYVFNVLPCFVTLLLFGLTTCFCIFK
jgi:hypothetical protein